MKKLVIISLALLIFLAPAIGLSSCRESACAAVSSLEKGTLTYLIAGFDDAAQNTDVLILLHYDAAENKAAVLQVPRDTYYNFGSGQNKINQIYSTARNSGKDAKAAMSQLVLCISETFGIEIDGYAGFTTDAFGRLVDHFGGIEINLPRDFIYEDENGENRIELKKGLNKLNGDCAEMFVRYRKGYAMGDLGRIDAQKLFLSALLKKVRSGVNFETVIKLITDSGEGMVSCIKVSEILGIITKKSGRLSEMNISYVTLPGQSQKNERGIWYYVCNKNSAERLISKLGFNLISGFDETQKLRNASNPEFEEIYLNQNIEWKLYSDETLGEMKITRK